MLGDIILRVLPIISPPRVRALGIPIRSIAAACHFSLITCENVKDYASVLKLRYLAYSAVGKAARGKPTSTMADHHDEIATIVMAKHGHRVVGSLRVVRPRPERLHEYEELTPIPSLLQDKATLVVVSRVCTHPGYRGSDLLKALVDKADEVALSFGRRYAIGGCTGELLPVYQRFGWRSSGVRYSHASLQGVSEQLIYKDLRPEN